MARKVFQIGFNRCATQPLSDFFRKNGLSSLHWERGELAIKVAAAIERGANPLADVPDVNLYSDMTYCDYTVCLEPFRQFEYIFRHYPDAYYVLNTRNCRDWIRSRKELHQGNFIERMISVLGVDSEEEVISRWIRDWYHHHHSVVEFFSHQKTARFLIFDIDRASANELVDFLSPEFPGLNPRKFGNYDRTRVGRNGHRERGAPVAP